MIEEVALPILQKRFVNARIYYRVLTTNDSNWYLPPHHSTMMKYTIGIHAQINIEMSLFKTYEITIVSMMTVIIMKKNQTYIVKNIKKTKGKHLKAKKTTKSSKTSSFSNRNYLFMIAIKL